MLLVETSPFVCTCVCNCAASQALPTTTTDQPAQIRTDLHDDTYHLTDNTLKMPVDVENGEIDLTDDSTNEDPLIETASISSSVETIPLTITEEDDSKPIPFLGDPFQVGSDITEVLFGVMPGQVLDSHEWHTLVTNQAGFDRTNLTSWNAKALRVSQ